MTSSFGTFVSPSPAPVHVLGSDFHTQAARPDPCLPLHPGPAGSQAWLQREQQLSPRRSPSSPPCSGCNLLAVPGQTPTHALPSSFKSRKNKTCVSLPCSDCRDLRLHRLLLQLPFPCSRSLSLGLGKEPLYGWVEGLCGASNPPCSLVIESQTSSDSHLCSNLRAIPAHFRVAPAGEWDTMGCGSRAARAHPLPCTSRCPGPGTTSGRRGVIAIGTREWHWPVAGLHGEQGQTGLYLFR